MDKLTRRECIRGVGVLGGAGLAAGALGRAVVGAGPSAADTQPGAKLTLGLPTYMFLHYNLDQTIEMARRVAVEHICLRSNLLPLESTADQIASAVRKVKDAGLVAYAGGVIYMRDAQGVGRAFDYAAAAGFKLITVNLPPGLLPVLDREVRKRDIRAAIHNHGPEDKHYPTPEAIHEKIKALDPRVGICHDTGHTQRAGVDPVEATLKTADRLMDVHLKDVDAAEARGHSTELGRGVVDICGLLRALVKVRYAGVVGIEYEKQMKDLLPGLAECVGYARGALAALGSPLLNEVRRLGDCRLLATTLGCVTQVWGRSWG